MSEFTEPMSGNHAKKTLKIAVVTATRAEYGLLSNLIEQMHQHPQIELQLFVTGAHLLPSQGLTVEYIRNQSVPITEEVPIFEQDNQIDVMTEVTARALAEFGKRFQRYQPDGVIVLGDRYELLGICSAALLSHVPIIHLHGGEITQGAMDEAIRHAVTKMASLHFVAADEYRQRVIQMGETPKCVYQVGAIGLDVIQHMPSMALDRLQAELKTTFTKPLLVVTYHPVTWGETQGKQALKNLFTALEMIEGSTVIWTAANTDEDGEQINAEVKKWVSQTHLNAHFFYSLGSQRYLNLLKQADAVVGNSSSGIIEAPAVGVATVNIGERQAGRLMAKSIIQSSEKTEDMSRAIEKALKFDDWQNNSLYGQGETAKQIIKVLLKTDFKQLKTKQFYDLSAEHR